MNSICKTIALDIIGDNRGSLIAIESLKTINFDIRRVYYIYGTDPDVTRGQHAHRSLNQLAIALHGSCKFLLDDGCDRKTITLSKPNVGLIITSMVWREMYDFSHDCVLLVLADAYYDENDYIRNYADFINIISTIK